MSLIRLRDTVQSLIVRSEILCRLTVSLSLSLSLSLSFFIEKMIEQEPNVNRAHSQAHTEPSSYIRTYTVQEVSKHPLHKMSLIRLGDTVQSLIVKRKCVTPYECKAQSVFQFYLEASFRNPAANLSNRHALLRFRFETILHKLHQLIHVVVHIAQ